MSKNDTKLRDVINSSNLSIADGISMVWLSRRAGYTDVDRLTGIDLAEHILSESKDRQWKLFFLGALPENLDMAIENVKRRFNSPYIAGYHHGYFKENEIDKIIRLINQSHADILLIGLGMPQKEYFIHDYLNKINVRFCLAVGGAFDVWSESKKRTPKVIQRAGLEWLFRSFYDKRKFLNVTKYGLIFFKDLLFYKK